jgi:hypothetical protein
MQPADTGMIAFGFSNVLKDQEIFSKWYCYFDAAARRHDACAHESPAGLVVKPLLLPTKGPRLLRPN